ncbi:cAMP-dependent protein kinase [Aureococcus anophagefferens]|nr:cAMP-dependent protein kinase [Aureococcus anophagefferens]
MAAFEALVHSKYDVDDTTTNAKQGGKIFGERMELSDIASFEIVAHEKTATTAALLRRALRGHFVFEKVDEMHTDELVAAMARVELEPEELLFHRADASEHFYVVESGKLAAIDEQSAEACVFEAGETLGDAALLLTDATRRVTCAALEATTAWSLDRATFRLALASLSEARADAAYSALKGVELLSALTEDQLRRVARLVSLRRYGNGARIITRERSVFNDAFEGRIVLLGATTSATRCTSSTAAPSSAASSPRTSPSGPATTSASAPCSTTTRAADVDATQEDTRCFAISREVFEAHLGMLSDILEHNLRTHVLEVALAGRAEDLDLGRLAEAVDVVTFAKGDEIATADEPADHLFVPKPKLVPWSAGARGEALDDDADCYAFTVVAESERLLLPAERRGPRGRGVRKQYEEVVEPVKTDALSDDDTVEAPQRPSLTTPRRTSVNVSTRSLLVEPGGARPRAHTIALRASAVDDFEVFKTLGVGSFGRVSLARHEASHTVCALKVLSKSLVVLTRQARNVKSERDLLLSLRHPLILRCYGTFHDLDCLYLILEVVMGGELHRLLHGDDGNERNRLPLKDAAFYASNVILALKYAHGKRVLYRDVKPENLLVDRNGYLKVVDFGFGKRLGDDELRSYTMCGTPEYLAPEVIDGSGHAFAADFWSVGCLLFEMLAGEDAVPPWKPEVSDDLDCHNFNFDEDEDDMDEIEPYEGAVDFDYWAE